MTTSSQTPTDAGPGQAVATRPAGAPRPPAPAVGMAPDIDSLWRQCANLAQADILPPALRGSPGNIFAVALLGQQVGLPVMNAVLTIHVIEARSGRKTFVLAANLWAALARRAGHKVVKGEHTRETCTVYLQRRDDPETWHEATYTIEDAEIAGLLSNDNYRKNPKAMLYARATSTVVREAAAEVAMGFVDQYEAEAMTGEAPGPSGSLADAAAAREAAAAPPSPEKPAAGGKSDPIDAEVVPDPVPSGPSAQDLADLERAHAPGPDLDAGVQPTPAEVDERRVAGEGEDPADAAATTTARPPAAGDWAAPAEEPAPSWTPTGPDPWAPVPAEDLPAGQVPTDPQRAYLEAIEEGKGASADAGYHPKTVEAVRGRGWVERSSGRTELTDAGRAALVRGREAHR